MSPARPPRRARPAARAARGLRGVLPALLALALGLALGLRPARAEPGPGFALAARVPASTLAFLRVPSPRAFAVAFAATAAGRLTRDADVAPFADATVTAIEAYLARAARGEEPSCPRVLAHAFTHAAALEGDVQVALLDVDPATGPRWAAALDFGPRVAAFLHALHTLANDTAGALAFTPTPGGGTLAVAGEAMGAALAVRGTTIVVTNDPSALEALVADAPRASGSLADTTALTSVGGAGAAGALATLVFDPGALADQAPGLAPGTSGRRVADALGLAGVVVAGYRLGIEGDDLVERLVIRAPGREARLPSLLAGRTGPRATRAAAPPQAIVAFGAGIAPAAGLARVRAVLAVADEDAADRLERGLATWREGTGDDLHALLAPLGDDVTAWIGRSPQGGLFPDVGCAVSVRDPAALEAAVTRAAAGLAAASAAAGTSVRVREAPFRGVTLRWVEDGGDAPGLASAVRLAWAVVDGTCLVAPHVHGLRETVARRLAHEPSFADRPDPAPAGAVASAEGAFGALVGVGYDTVVPWMQSFGGARSRGRCPIPFGDAAPTRALALALRPLSLAVVPGPEGVAFDARGPVPALAGVLVGLAVVALRAPQAPGGATPAPPFVASTADPAVADPEETTAEALEATFAALEEYAALFGALPARLDDLAVRGRVLGRVPMDGWGRPLVWARRADGRRGEVRSVGADGRPHTDDDRTVEVEAPAK